MKHLTVEKPRHKTHPLSWQQFQWQLLPSCPKLPLDYQQVHLKLNYQDIEILLQSLFGGFVCFCFLFVCLFSPGAGSRVWGEGVGMGWGGGVGGFGGGWRGLSVFKSLFINQKYAFTPNPLLAAADASKARMPNKVAINCHPGKWVYVTVCKAS